MYYKRGIDITNDKQMFNFLKNHLKASIGVYSIQAASFVHSEAIVNIIDFKLNHSSEEIYNYLITRIQEWEQLHSEYEIIVDNNHLTLAARDPDLRGLKALPDSLDLSDTYEDYKHFCKKHYGSIKANRGELVYYTKLVRDFDRLCDEIRDFCNSIFLQEDEIRIPEEASAKPEVKNFRILLSTTARVFKKLISKLLK